jgi:hypothetical protein
MSEHQQFEIMCALAVVGQLNHAERVELRRHIEDCIPCQSRISDFAQISAQALTLSGERCSNRRPPARMTARFVTRARSEGIPLQKSMDTLPHDLFCSLGWKGNVAAALLILAVIAGGISDRIHSGGLSTATVSTAANSGSGGPLKTKSAEVRSTPRGVTPKRVVRQARPGHRFSNATDVIRRAYSWEAGFPAPLELVPSSTRYSGNCYQGGIPQNASLFSRSAEIEEPRFFQTLASSQRSRPIAPWLISLNSLPPVFLYSTDRSFVTGLHGSEMEARHPSVDWYKVWLGAHSQSSVNSNGLPTYQRHMLVPRWPFSNEFQVDPQ